MTMPTPGQPDPAADPNTDPASGEPHGDPNEPKSVEDQLAELTQKLADLQANSRKWEDRAKANKAKADELDQLKQANASDAEKLRMAEEKASQAARDLARYRVAAETGVPPELLHGADEDAMRQQANALKEFAKANAPKPSAPRPDPSQGPKTGQKPNPRDLGAAEAERRFGSKK